MICLHRIAVLAVAICLTIACFPSKSAAAEGMVYTNFKESTNQVSNPCLGVHNDGVLSGADDDGTYGESCWNHNKELTWQNNHNRCTSFVGGNDMLADQSKTTNAIRDVANARIAPVKVK